MFRNYKEKKIVTQAITQFFATTMLQQIMSCEEKVVSLCVSDRQVIHNLQHQSLAKSYVVVCDPKTAQL